MFFSKKITNWLAVGGGGHNKLKWVVSFSKIGVYYAFHIPIIRNLRVEDIVSVSILDIICFRSSHLWCSIKSCVFKKFTKFTGKHPWRRVTRNFSGKGEYSRNQGTSIKISSTTQERKSPQGKIFFFSPGNLKSLNHI